MRSVKKDKKHVLLLENIHKDAERAFKKAGWKVTTHPKAMSEDELLKTLPDVDVLGIRSKTQVTRKVIEKNPHLDAIGAFCIGTNQIELGVAGQHGVAVFNAPFSNTRSVVEMTMALIIMLMRKACDASTQVHAGGWPKTANGCYEVRRKKLGIIGYGNIGSQLSTIAGVLGMHVAFYDINERLPLGNTRKKNSLNEILKWSEIITLHVDGRKENENLIGARELAKMPKGSYLINISRGHVVDVKALARAIKRGHIAGAAIDVFPEEPKGKDETFVSELQGLPNVILTPHIGGSTEEAQEGIGSFVASKLISYVNTGDSTLSLNIPEITMNGIPKNTFRITHLHENVPGRLAAINEALAARNVNILGQLLKTNEYNGYVVTDCAGKPPKDLHETLLQIPHTIKTEIL